MPRVVYTVPERVQMVKQHEQGLSYRHIVDHFAAMHPERPIPSVSTVRRIVKSFTDTGNVDPAKKPKTVYPNRQLSRDAKLNIVLAVTEAHGKKPLTQVAEELQVSMSSIYKTLHAVNYGNKQRKKKKPTAPKSDDKSQGSTPKIKKES